MIGINTNDNYPPPIVTVPLSWEVDKKAYCLRSIIFRDAEKEHYSSLIVKKGHWYSSQYRLDCIKPTLFHEGAIHGLNWADFV